MEERFLPHLSDAARRILQLNAEAAYAKLVPQASSASAEVRAILAGMSPVDVLAGRVASMDDAACVLAGLWLWHDGLEESHHLSQNIKTPSGSYWHAIMHRREGDFWNSKYWLNRCPEHPAFHTIALEVARIINARRNADPRLIRLTLGDWNPHAFVDLVEAVVQQSDETVLPVVVELQRAEWRGLMTHGVAAAAGRPL